MSTKPERKRDRGTREVSRRKFMAAGTAAMAAIASGCGGSSPGFVESLLRRNFRELSPEQASYIGVEVAGPYKPEHYRY